MTEIQEAVGASPDTDAMARLVHEAVRTDYVTVKPRTTNWPSDAGHPCAAYLVFARTHWREKPPPDEGACLIFREGNSQEQAVLDLLRQAGYVITRQQEPLFDAATLLSGHPDGWLSHPQLCPVPTPFDAKSMHPHIWQRMNGEHDLDEYEWTAKYPAQIRSYLFLCRRDPRGEHKPLGNLDYGFLVLKNKSSGAVKFVAIHWSDSFAQELEMRLGEVNAAVKMFDGLAEADRASFSDMISPLKSPGSYCRKCPFLATCAPASFPLGKEGELGLVIDDPEILDALLTVEKLAQIHEENKAYEAATKFLRERLKDVTSAICGPFVLTGKAQKWRQPARAEISGTWWNFHFERTEPEGPAA